MEVVDETALARAQRIATFWSRPVLTNSEVAEALNLPTSTYAAVKAAGKGPPTFKIGTRIATEKMRGNNEQP